MHLFSKVQEDPGMGRILHKVNHCMQEAVVHVAILVGEKHVKALQNNAVDASVGVISVTRLFWE